MQIGTAMATSLIPTPPVQSSTTITAYLWSSSPFLLCCCSTAGCVTADHDIHWQFYYLFRLHSTWAHQLIPIVTDKVRAKPRVVIQLIPPCLLFPSHSSRSSRNTRSNSIAPPSGQYSTSQVLVVDIVLVSDKDTDWTEKQRLYQTTDIQKLWHTKVLSDSVLAILRLHWENEWVLLLGCWMVDGVVQNVLQLLHYPLSGAFPERTFT